jgi:hypothetical protein
MNSNVIGYKGTEEDRTINWSVLRSLREQLKFYNNRPNEFLIAKDKQSKAYKKFFRDYIS